MKKFHNFCFTPDIYAVHFEDGYRNECVGVGNQGHV